MEQSAQELEQRRQPSAMRELADDPSSRKRFLAMVGGAGAASAFSIFLAACGEEEEQPAQTEPQTSTAPMGAAQFGEGDIGIANYALTLEYLEAAFYDAVLQSGKITNRDQVSLAKKIGQNEKEHVAALEKLIQQKGGTPAKAPRTEFPLESPDAILKLAATVENLGAAAYLGQADKIADKEVLAAALSIHTVEGRHAAALNQATGQPVTPDGAFAKPATVDEVLEQVKPFIKS